MQSDLARRGEPGGARFVDPKVLGRIESLEILARTVVEGFISGLHRSPYLGRSMDFAEHRAYMPGDDIRRIDWRVFARTDRFYVKQFEADSNVNCTLVLDMSQSMNFASQGVTKLDYGRYLTACLAYFCHKQKDRVGLVTFDNDVVDYVPPSAKHLEVVLHTIDRLKPGKNSDLKKPLLKVADAVRRRSMVVLISDFYDETEAILEAVRILRYKGNDLIVFHLLDRAELQFDFDRPAEFRDLETHDTLAVMPEYLRDQYQSLIREHTETLATKLGEHLIDYVLFDTSRPLDFALYDYMSYRQRRHRTLRQRMK